MTKKQMKSQTTDPAGNGITRREALRRAGAGGLLLASPALLAACGGSESTSPSSATGTPAATSTGGVLRVGVVGGSTKEILDPHDVISEAVYPRIFNLFDLPGFRTADTFEPDYRLVEEVDRNTSGDAWDVRLRDGVEFHNGKTMGAEDLIFTMERIMDPTKPTLAAGSLNFMRPQRFRKLDKRTVRFELERPFAPFVDALFNPYDSIVPVGFDPHKPVGTGPFKFQSITPGSDSVFVRFENYWGDGPYVDELHIIDFMDDSARVNALLGGQVEAIDAVPASQVQVFEQTDGINMLNSKTGAWRPLMMRMDVAPFDDVRVRQAMRLVADRQQMIDASLDGNGQIANDIFSPNDKCYAGDEIPQRERDVDRARSLLKQAGQEGLSVELVTAPIAGGIVEASQAFAEQAAEAGINVKLRKVDSTLFWDREYANAPFLVDFWPNYPYLNTAAQSEMPGGAFNATYTDDPKLTKLFNDATKEFDDGKRCEIIGEMQRWEHENGAYLIWGFANTLDAYSDKVTGFAEDVNGWDLHTYAFKNVSFV